MSLLIEDAALLRDFKAGVPRALERVYVAYLPFVHTLLRRGFTFHAAQQMRRFSGMASEFEREDLAHEVFVRAFSEATRGSYDGVRPYRDFLRGVTRNTVIDLCFRRGDARVRTATVASDEGPEVSETETAGNVGSDPETGSLERELLGLATRFRDTLDARERGILDGRQQGLSQEEVCNVVKLSRPTVRKLERDIRTRFFDFMQAHGYFESTEADATARRRTIACLLLFVGLP